MMEQEKTASMRKWREVEGNRKIMMRVIDTVIFLGKQELSFRGHNESLTNTCGNVGNFLETLKLIGIYDEVIASHLEKVLKDHVRNQELCEKKKAAGKSGHVGRGSKLTFLSNHIQNKHVEIISQEIVSFIIEKIDNCIAWAIIADTTPDVTKHEQFSLCVRIVGKDGQVSEHLLFCVRASSTTGEELFNCIKQGLEKRNVKLDDLVAQTYDGAANMSGKYKGLQALIKEHVGEHVVFTHCYAHSLNLVLSDAACASLLVICIVQQITAPPRSL